MQTKTFPTLANEGYVSTLIESWAVVFPVPPCASDNGFVNDMFVVTTLGAVIVPVDVIVFVKSLFFMLTSPAVVPSIMLAFP